ncbi:hypothetical protein VOLCADRAFT_96361 [Volvox carteri f. nagariensis]|uniref:Uncharacterized protein n=1 Tax=Volvox carteri f. nagariensis TaxID=3068 RepID=D8U9X2_VOLCA|nr:uncharacterized protein VOLCADRAFT_96361 [Volvox carteri f. nagariensis]EFJ43548.1 hypothetical protein VOLCADRAFT_96361 [Volvox carteri f. nagariensis]|eukprot:XP_002955477.1 hypothetical protein VOLCADRAFT_96361 [Volvox carteri f. nagariensis]
MILWLTYGHWQIHGRTLYIGCLPNDRTFPITKKLSDKCSTGVNGREQNKGHDVPGSVFSKPSEHNETHPTMPPMPYNASRPDCNGTKGNETHPPAALPGKGHGRGLLGKSGKGGKDDFSKPSEHNGTHPKMPPMPYNASRPDCNGTKGNETHPPAALSGKGHGRGLLGKSGKGGKDDFSKPSEHNETHPTMPPMPYNASRPDCNGTKGNETHPPATLPGKGHGRGLLGKSGKGGKDDFSKPSEHNGTHPTMPPMPYNASRPDCNGTKGNETHPPATLPGKGHGRGLLGKSGKGGKDDFSKPSEHNGTHPTMPPMPYNASRPDCNGTKGNETHPPAALPAKGHGRGLLGKSGKGGKDDFSKPSGHNETHPTMPPMPYNASRPDCNGTKGNETHPPATFPSHGGRKLLRQILPNQR